MSTATNWPDTCDAALGDAGRELRLIALAGHGRDTDIVMVREARFDSHMTKPIDLDELEKPMASYLRT